MPFGTVSADLVVGTNGGRISPENTFGFRNRIINGAMVIDQRNAGASVTPTTGVYLLDRWSVETSQNSKFTYGQNLNSATLPTGFSNYLGCQTSTAYTPTSSDYFLLQQKIEGFNVSDLGWGTANAKTVTLSFQVYSSLTGTFGGNIQNGGATRFYPFTYTISSANTWTTISVTIAGDTTGTWLTTNGTGLIVRYGLGVGSTYLGTAGSWGGTAYFGVTGATSVVGTNGATFYITGVQLEVGSNATSFEYRPYGTELALCQRYYFKWLNDTGSAKILSNMQVWLTTAVYGKLIDLPVQMRAQPTTVTSSGSFYPSSQNGTGQPNFSSTNVDTNTKNNISTGNWGGSSGLVIGSCSVVYAANNAYIDASAEL
jgi:hypothetical protein